MRKFLAGLISIICIQYSYSQINNTKIPYYPNEKVDFSLMYGIFKIGDAYLEFTYDKKCPGAYIHAYAANTGLVKFIKDICFIYECCMDTVTGLPISDSRVLIEGDYVDINTVYYDRLSRKDSSLVYSTKTDTVVVPKNIYDLLSGFYHYRANFLGDNLPLNHTVSTTTFFIDEVWDLTIRYCGKETIKTNYGNVECLKIKPVTIIGHFFRTSEAMTIWITNSGNYIPVKFSVELKLGTLYGYITNYRGLSINILK
ncbi:MAG: DUF3108 domain-containing protein [Bacteroidales bacterium]|nr:DUF3108 domain-containing protein [Bacteroidales bacterium]